MATPQEQFRQILERNMRSLIQNGMDVNGAAAQALVMTNQEMTARQTRSQAQPTTNPREQNKLSSHPKNESDKSAHIASSSNKAAEADPTTAHSDVMDAEVDSGSESTGPPPLVDQEGKQPGEDYEMTDSDTPAQPAQQAAPDTLSETIDIPTIQRLLNEEGGKAKILALFSSPKALETAFPGEGDTVDLARVLEGYRLLTPSAAVPNCPSHVELGTAMCRAIAPPNRPVNSHVEWGSRDLRLGVRQAQVMMAFPGLFEPELFDTIAVGLFCAVDNMPRQEVLIEIWKTFPAEHLGHIVNVAQQWLTLFLCSGASVRSKDANLISVCDMIGLMFEANEESHVLPLSDFYNDMVNSSDQVDIAEEIMKWHLASSRPELFSFFAFPFLLDPHSKQVALQKESEGQMMGQFQEEIFRTLFTGSLNIMPYLLLRVRRSQVINDTIIQLQAVADRDLKKPLKVQFIGEEGIDEGGVQKEFFQILVRQLFDVNFGMFTYDEETRNWWFNSTSPDVQEFELVGTILGLAIYNSVTLNISLPITVYRKLKHTTLSLADLEDVNPGVYRGLKMLLEYEGNDVEEVFCVQFVTESEAFGERIVHELKPGGKDINVTSANKEEYVELFVKHHLQVMIADQFVAFEHGFRKVCDGRAMKAFHPEELQLLICGSPELDFHALEAICHYESGFTASSPRIRDFWDIIHGLPLDQQRKFLVFCTGSDRSPIRGLGSLPQGFTIARNGGDSDRLPTAHTCFNHLLLPEYSSKEKLRKLLLLAIENAEGFGLR